MSASRRDSAKRVGSGRAWKERLRSECFERLRQERQRILWAARGDQQAVHGALQQLISNVTGDLGAAAAAARQQGQPAGGLLQTAGPLAGLAPPATPTSAAAPAAPTPGGAASAQDNFQLEGEEYLELMRALEESLLEDRLQEEADYLAQLEQEEVAAAVEAYYSLPEQAQQPGPQAGAAAGPHLPPGVPCPICRQAYLVQHKGVILCPRQDLRLDVALEKLTLEDLRQRLAAALEAHAGRGCPAQPAFGVQQRQQGGLLGEGSLLCMACQHCGCFEVVL